MLSNGKKKNEQTRKKIISYNANRYDEKFLDSFSQAEESYNEETITWINIDRLHDSSVMQDIAEIYELERYILSDVLDTYSRPKLIEYDDYIYLSAKMLQFNEAEGTVYSENLSLLFNGNELISFQERPGDMFEPVRGRIRKNKKRIRTTGAD